MLWSFSVAVMKGKFMFVDIVEDNSFLAFSAASLIFEEPFYHFLNLHLSLLNSSAK